MPSILSLQQITKFYGALCALDQVSFEVPAHSIFGILGPNGSGKTTLLGTVTDVLKPASGTYRWFEKPPDHQLRKQIGTLLETPNFYPYLSAEDNLYINAAIKGCDRKEVARVLQLVGLSGRSRSLFRTFSLGMKQRMALASAMLGDPPVVVLDEPTNGLDPVGIADIRALIQQMGENGKTVIMASHLLDEVEKVCTHVAILKKGKLLASGPVSEILTSEEVIEMAATGMDRLREVISAHPAVKTARLSGDTLQVVLNTPVESEALNRYCFDHQIILSLLRKKKKSLELKFIELTGEPVLKNK
jgi:ABC-2 type transport system ATP-binding protein